MKQTIEIEVPDGKKAVWKYGKVVFEDIESQLPKTWEEFCKIYPLKGWEAYIDCNSTIKVTCRGRGKRLNKSDRSYLPSTKAAEQHLALMQLHQLRDCYRQGWIPNNDSSDTIYNVYRYYNISAHKYSYSIFESLYMDDFLSFQSIEIAEKFLNNFKDLIEQAGDLI